MKKNFKKLFSVFLSVVMVFTVCYSAIMNLTGFAAQSSTVLVDFEKDCDITWAAATDVGEIGIQSNIKSEGSQAFLRDWGYRTLKENMFTLSKESKGNFDLSNADVLALDLYISDIRNWKTVYEDIAYILIAEEGYSETVARYKAVKIPCGLNEGWNSLEINLSELNMQLNKIAAFRFTHSDKWTNEGSEPAYSVSEEECDVTLCVDNIRKIKSADDTYTPDCLSTEIYVRSSSDTHLTLGYGQFSDNITEKKNITYEIFLSEEKLTKENVESASYKTSVKGILGASFLGLKEETAYYAAVKAIDEAGNYEYLFSESSFETAKKTGNISVDFLSCETSSDEGFGPPYVPQGAKYNTSVKTQGTASLANTLKNRNLYQNLIVAYRKNAPADLSKCNSLLLDFYIDDIDVFNTYWKDRCYILISDEDVKQNETDSFLSFAVSGDLAEGWNSLKFPLKSGIDLSRVWTLRVSAEPEWVNASTFKPNTADCEVLIAIDNIRGESATIEEDINPPAFSAEDLDISEYKYDGFTFSLPEARDAFSPANTIVYKVYCSEEKITESNIKGLEEKAVLMDTSSVTVEGLKASTDYYIGIEAIDEAGNRGYYITDKTLTTSKEGYVYVPFLSCEQNSEEVAGPNGVANGYHYNTELKTEGAASLSNTVTKRDVYYNLTMAYRTNSSVDMSDCNVLSLDFYIEDIEVFDKYWRNHLYVQLSDQDIKNMYATSYLSFAIGGNLKSGWNTLQFALTNEIDLSNVWNLRISPAPQWTNDPVYTPESDDCALKISVDNVRGEKIGIADDKVAPVYTGSTVDIAEYKANELTVLWATAADAITEQSNIEYELYCSEEKITKENADTFTPNQKISGKNTATVKNLKAATEYYFAVKALDEAGNFTWLFSDKVFKTESKKDYVKVPFLKCEANEEEVAGPDWVANGYFYNTELKTEGKASLSNVITNRDVFYNLTMGYRKNSAVDMSECNVLSLDFYIDDIEVFDKYWRDHCYILISDQNVGQGETTSYLSFPVSGDLKEGWNSLQFPLSKEIDLSCIWNLRISPLEDWYNQPWFNTGTPDSAVLISIDNVRGERISTADDDRAPEFDYNYIRSTYLGNTAATISFANAKDNLTVQKELTYELLLSEEEITDSNADGVKNITSAIGVQKITVKGLNPETQYYYAVRAIDKAGNKSSLLTASEPLKTLKTESDHWYLVSDAEAESGVTILPNVGIANIPSFSTEIKSEGKTSALKKMVEGDVWGNMVQLNVISDISFATRVDFKLYIDSEEVYEKYWYEHLYFVIGDEWGQALAYKIPEDVKTGWNKFSVSLYGQAIDLTAISAIRMTPVAGMQNEGASVEKEEGIDKSLTIALDEITAVYDASLLPTVAPSDDNAYYITSCDELEEEGYWNVGVTIDEFEKTQGAASVYKKFTAGQLSANAFNFVASEPLNMNDAEELLFDLYVSNPALLKNRTEIYVKLGSLETFDSAFMQFKLPMDTLQAGWNQITIPMEDAVESLVGFDFGEIKCFSLYCTKAIFLKGESVDIRLDNVRMTGELMGTYGGGDSNDGVILYPEDYYVTEEEVITTEITEYIKSEPTRTVKQKNILHKMGLPIYIWILAIGAPVLTVIVLLLTMIISGKKRKKAIKSN